MKIRTTAGILVIVTMSSFASAVEADAVSDCKAGRLSNLSGIELQACLQGDYSQLEALEANNKSLSASSNCEDDGCPKGTMYGGLQPNGKVTVGKAAC